MGVQIPCGIYRQVSAQVVVRATAPTSGRGVPPLGRAERKSGTGRALDVGPRAHAFVDSAEVRGVGGGGLHQRQECDSLGSDLWRAQAELHRTALLGTWLLCFN